VAPRKALEDAIDFAREGDVLCVTKLDRLARSVAHLCELVARLQAKSVALHILNLNIDTGTPTGKLMLHLLGSIAEFERQIMLERQREGIAKAKSEGKYKGRAPTARAKTELILEMVRAGKTREAVAEELNISARSVFRILRDHRVAKNDPVERAA
jgi:DNA invertase Pin-like site-specific DNA recombinase